MEWQRNKDFSVIGFRASLSSAQQVVCTHHIPLTKSWPKACRLGTWYPRISAYTRQLSLSAHSATPGM